MRRLRSEDAGYSLVELIVVMAVTSVVLGGMTAVFVSGSKAEMDMNKRFQAQQASRMALARFRVDVHLAGCASSGASQTSLSLYATPKAIGSCTGTATTTWCTAGSTAVPGVTRWAVYRASGATCNSSAGTLVADYLTSNQLFTTNAPAAGSLQRASVTVTFPANAGTTANSRVYKLTDTIVLRNSPPA